jgi:hypothetical protein
MDATRANMTNPATKIQASLTLGLRDDDIKTGMISKGTRTASSGFKEIMDSMVGSAFLLKNTSQVVATKIKNPVGHRSCP